VFNTPSKARRRVKIMESWKAGKLESWKAGKLESLEAWKLGSGKREAGSGERASTDQSRESAGG
jgi:hypothetical protein